MSRLQKGIIALLLVLVIVVAIGYAGIHYLETSVAGAVRQWAAQSPEQCRITLGDVHYSFRNNTLTLDNATLTLISAPQKKTIRMDSLEIRGIGATFLSLLRDQTTPVTDPELPLADAIIATNITTRMEMGSGSDVIPIETSIGQRTFSDIRINTARLKALLARSTARTADTADITTEIAYAIAYRKALTTGITIRANAGFNRFTAEKLLETDIHYGHGGKAQLSDITAYLSSSGQPGLSMEELTFENINLPEPAVLEKATNLPDTCTNEEALALLGSLFTSTGQPLIGSISLTGLKVLPDQFGPVALGSFRIANPKVQPFTLELTAEHLALPLGIHSNLQALRFAGMEKLDLSGTFSFTAPDSSNSFHTAISLNMAGAGTADMAVTGSVSPAELHAFIESVNRAPSDSAVDRLLEQWLYTHPRLISLEVGYADEGLLPRLLHLAQYAFGLSTETCLGLIRSQIRDAAVEIGPQAASAAARLNTFIDQPGAFRLFLRPARPLTWMDMERRIGLPVIQCEVTPGPKPIQELVDALD